jgi:hypothetical protein
VSPEDQPIAQRKTYTHSLTLSLSHAHSLTHTHSLSQQLNEEIYVHTYQMTGGLELARIAWGSTEQLEGTGHRYCIAHVGTNRTQSGARPTVTGCKCTCLIELTHDGARLNVEEEEERKYAREVGEWVHTFTNKKMYNYTHTHTTHHLPHTHTHTQHPPYAQDDTPCHGSPYPLRA